MNNYITSKKLIMYLASIVVASVLLNIVINIGINIEYFKIDGTKLYKDSDLNNTNIIISVGLKRLKQLVVLIVLAQVVNIEYVFNGFLIIIGAIFGIILSVQSYYYGIIGVLIGLVCLLPQFLIYYLGVYLYYSFKKNGGVYFKKNPVDINANTILFLVFSLILVGIVVESYFSEIFLKNIYQYIVVK